MSENLKKRRLADKYRQPILYFTFAAAMIALNYFIQWLNRGYISVFVANHFGNIEIIQKYYLSKEPINWTELVGSIVAVIITYLVKFVLDKFIVFEKKDIHIKQTSKEFTLYFSFAILTTIENVGIQAIMTNIFGTTMGISVVIALCIGYGTKFLLDRRYTFKDRSNKNQKEE